jgi:ribosomal protein S27E
MPPGWNASDESVDEYNPEEERGWRRGDGGGEGVEEAVNAMSVSCDLCGTVVHKNSMKKHKDSQKCQIRRHTVGEVEVEAVETTVSCDMCGTIVSKKSIKKHKESQKCQIMRQTDLPSPAKRHRRNNGN